MLLLKKEAMKRWSGELHRLLNSRTGSIHSTYRKNTEANDKAYAWPCPERTKPSTGRCGLIECCIGHGNQRHTKPRAANLATPSGSLQQPCWPWRIMRGSKEGGFTNPRSKAQRHGDPGRCGGPQGANQTHHERARQGRGSRQWRNWLPGSSPAGSGQGYTHSLTCGVPDRESNGTKYLMESTELIEEWQHRLQSGQPVSGLSSDHGEVMLVERHKISRHGSAECKFGQASCAFRWTKFVNNSLIYLWEDTSFVLANTCVVAQCLVVDWWQTLVRVPDWLCLSDSKNWTFLFEIWAKELNLVLEHDSKILFSEFLH